MSDKWEGMGVRFVGGVEDGREQIFPSRREFVYVPKHPDFAVCLPGLGCDVDAPASSIPHDHQERYRVHQIKFDSGHVHYYAAPERVPLVGIMNQLWHSHTRQALKEQGDE